MRRRGALSLAAAVGVGAAALAVPATSAPAPGPATGTCTEPFAPIYAASTSADGVSNRRQLWPEHPVSPPPADGTDLDAVRPRYLAGPDTDGDGRGDQVTIDLGSGEQVMVITRGDGEVRIGQRGSNLGELTSRPVGDLDADGRDEVMFLARPSAGGEDQIFVLPGSTPTGSHQADDVSIEIPSYFLFGAGDQLDGPGDDLLVTDTADVGSGIVSGREVMAPGPGGRLASFPIAEALAGYPAGVFDLGGPRPALTTIEDEGSRSVVRLWRDGRATSFATAGADLGEAYLSVSMTRADGRTYLRAGTSDRGGSTTFTWDVDDPCRTLGGPDAPGGPASPAAPVSGQASYTG
jgi:hypothetical protein